MKNTSNGKSLQRELLKIVEASGSNGVSMKSLIKYFKIEDNRISELVELLERRKLVKVVKIKQGNREELLLYPSKVKVPMIPISLVTVSEVPCFSCKYLKECEVEKNPSPTTCEILKIWIEKKVKESNK
ncbi:MAG TPA: hypothetical protein ENO36_02975 [Fervidicoccus fontis]|uniref:B-block binding subunit of TFIIIC domain-containing protein n=1 Tax=Fervidicoccus fontis TaxID=683846 RepID=A0A7C2Z431_9CREN|nr:hypothetical protein [Fervidicoccus fontis]